MSEHIATEKRDIVRDLYRTLYETYSFDVVWECYAPDTVRHGGLQGTVEGENPTAGRPRWTLGQGSTAVRVVGVV